MFDWNVRNNFDRPIHKYCRLTAITATVNLVFPLLLWYATGRPSVAVCANVTDNVSIISL